MELKGKFGANYYLNTQMKKEFREYLKYLKSKEEVLTPEDYLFKSQKLGKPYNRVSISRLFANIYKKFNIHGASHFGRHLFVSKLVNSGVNIFQFRHQFVRCCHLNSLCLIALRIKTIHWIVFIYAVQRLANHRNISADNYAEYGVGLDKSLTDNWNLSLTANRRDGSRQGWNGSVELKYNF